MRCIIFAKLPILQTAQPDLHTFSTVLNLLVIVITYSHILS